MLNIKSVDHINLNVKNLEESVQWYNTVFGLVVKEEGVSNSGNPYKIIGKPNSIYLALYQNEVEDGGFVNHIGFNLTNFDESIRFLKEKKIELGYGGVIKYPNSKSAYILDPTGIEIELSSNFGGGLN